MILSYHRRKKPPSRHSTDGSGVASIQRYGILFQSKILLSLINLAELVAVSKRKIFSQRRKII